MALDELEQRLRQLEERRPGLEQRLQDALRERSGVTPLVEMEERAGADILASPAIAREQFKDVFDPFVKEKLVAERVSREAGLLNFLSRLTSERKETVNDLVKNLVGVFEAEQRGLEAQFQRAVTKEQLAIQRSAASRAARVDVDELRAGAIQQYMACMSGRGGLEQSNHEACRAAAIATIEDANLRRSIESDLNAINIATQPTAQLSPVSPEQKTGSFFGGIRAILRGGTENLISAAERRRAEHKRLSEIGAQKRAELGQSISGFLRNLAGR